MFICSSQWFLKRIRTARLSPSTPPSTGKSRLSMWDLGVGWGWDRSMRAMAKSGSLSIWISATHALSIDAVKTFKLLLNLSVSKRNYFKAQDECIQHDAPSALPKYLDF